MGGIAEDEPSVDRVDVCVEGDPGRESTQVVALEASWLSSPTRGDLGRGLEEGMGSTSHSHMLLSESLHNRLATCPLSHLVSKTPALYPSLQTELAHSLLSHQV